MRSLVLVSILIASRFVAPLPALAAGEISFRRDIAPILARRCTGCHGPEEARGEYRLDSFDALLTAGQKEDPPIVAGDPDASYLVQLLVHDSASKRMPKESDALPDAEIDAIRRWIAAGAHFDGESRKAPLASMIVIAQHPKPPEPYSNAMPVTALAFTPDGSAIVAGSYHELTLWDTGSGSLVRRIGNVEQRSAAIRFSPDSSQLAVAGGTPGRRGEVSLLAFPSGAVLHRIALEADVIHDVAFSPDGARVAAACSSGAVRIHDAASGAELTTIRGHSDWVLGVAWSPDGARIATASRDKSAKIFDAANGAIVANYTGHGDTVHGVAFSPDGESVWTCSADTEIHRWNATDAKKSAEHDGFGAAVFEIALAGASILACSADGTARELTAESAKELRVYRGHADHVFATARDPGATRIATGAYDGEIRIWNATDATLIRAFRAVPPPRETRRY